jgi:hypothetical protein
VTWIFMLVSDATSICSDGDSWLVITCCNFNNCTRVTQKWKIRQKLWFWYEFCCLIVLAVVAFSAILCSTFLLVIQISPFPSESNNLVFHGLNIIWKWNFKKIKQLVFCDCDCYCLFKHSMKDIVETLLYISVCRPLVILFVDWKCGQGLTWLLPERFSESEIGPEAGFVNFW